MEVAFDTDVNAAALGEFRWGAAQDLDNFLYLTVGTGIGGGGMVNGRLMHGRTHPEMGHIRIPHDRADDPFAGTCPYHGDCLEGLACAPAIRARWGQAGETSARRSPSLGPGSALSGARHRQLDLHALPAAHRSGRRRSRPQELYPLVQAKVAALLNGYVEAPEIVPPLLGSRAGVLGAIALALSQAG